MICGCRGRLSGVAPHSFLYFIVRAGNGIFAIATLAVFTRMLSPTEYGVYALGMAIASVASAIIFQWLSLAVGRFYPLHLDDPGQVMGVAACGFWAATAAATLLFLGALPFHEVFNVAPTLAGILFLITVMLGSHALALQVANAQSAPFRYGLLSWAKGGGALLIGFILIYYGMGAWGALLGFLAGLVLSVSGFGPKLGLRMSLDSGRSGLSVEMLRYGLPLTLNSLAIVVVDVVDRFLIGSLLGMAYVAPYAVAYDLVQLSIGSVMSVLFLAAFPLIVKAFESEGNEAVRIRLQALGGRLVVVGLPVAVGLGILATEISELIFGNDYRPDAATVMPWLAAAIFVAAFKSYFLDVVFQLCQATKRQAYIAILMAAVNILLNLLLLPHHGIIAAAWATLAAFSVGAVASWLVGNSVFLLPALGHVFLRSILASATMAVLMYMLPSKSGIIWLLIKIVSGFVTYSAMALALDVAGFRRLLRHG